MSSQYGKQMVQAITEHEIRFAIITIHSFSNYSSFSPSMVDLKKRNIYSKVLDTLSCYIALLFFSTALLVYLFNDCVGTGTWHYGCITVLFLLAFGSTLTEFSSKEICPRPSQETPIYMLNQNR